MAIRNSAKYLLAAVLAAACTVQDPVQQQAPNQSEPASAYAGSILTVEFDNSLVALVEEAANQGITVTKSADLNAVMRDLGVESMERVFPFAGKYEARTRKEGLHRFYHVKVAEDVPVTKAQDSFAAIPGVISARAARRISLRGFNDPYFPKQWHYLNKSYANADINVNGVWNMYTYGSDKVTVCVVDEPIDQTHPDLLDNLWTDSEGHTGYNFARDSYDLSIRPVEEGKEGDIGHGTHVAGTISAVNNNGIGVSGIAGGNYAAGIPGVRLQSCAIFSGRKKADDYNTAAAIKWGADHGALISQNSWGYSADGCLGDEPDGRISASEMAAYKSWDIDTFPEIKAAIDYFIKYAGCDADGNQKADSPMKGGLVIFAAGNENIDWDVIGTYDAVIEVGAFGENGSKASYSNYGNWVDIAAPGGGGRTQTDVIWSTVPDAVSTVGYEGIDSKGYAWVGTSMACPHVSGVAALIISYFGQEGFTADDCKDILFSGLGDVIGGSATPIGKKIDAMASFEYGVEHYPQGGGGEQPPIEPAPEVIISHRQVTLKSHQIISDITVTSTPGSAISCTAPGSKGLSFDPETGVVTIDALKLSPGTYTAVFTAVSYKTGKEGTASLEYTILPNHAPQVISVPENIHHRQLVSATTLYADDIFSDADGEALSIGATVDDPNVAAVSVKGGEIYLYSSAWGVTEVTITATDARGEHASVSFRLAVTDSSHPVHISQTVVTRSLTIGIEADEPTTVEIEIYSSTGVRVYKCEIQADVYNPAQLDLSTLAPGRYTLSITYNGETYRSTLIKG